MSEDDYQRIVEQVLQSAAQPMIATVVWKLRRKLVS
jgi:hypothetical protein